MNNEIKKSESPDPEDMLTAITSFNDPSILTDIFKELGWDYSFEIRQWLQMARQNANLAVKAKALIQLRKLLREAAESAGYTANVSQTIPNAQGGQTTFSAKRISGILNPTKQIESTEIKEPQDDRQKPKPDPKTEPDRGSNRQESQDDKGHSENSRHARIQEITGERDTLSQFPIEPDAGRADTSRDVVPGGTKPPDGGETSGQQPGLRRGTSTTTDKTTEDGGKDNPCIQTRPPTCDHDLYPGISTSAERA